MEKKEKKEIKARLFNIMQYVKHKETGEELLNEETIKNALSKAKLERWAYILHDKDTNEDGTLKEPHWHIVLEFENRVLLKSVAKWFGIEENFVEVPTGRNAFMSCAKYLVHWKTEEKYQYEWEEVKDNFNLKEVVEKEERERLEYGRNLTEEERIMAEVLYNGVTLKQCRRKYKYLNLKLFEKLKKCRAEYLSQLPPPKTRINFYIEGEGGIGKGLFSRALALSLFNEYEDETEVFFEVGAENVTFEGYDGQPVVIWNDCRAYDLLKKLGGRDNVFNVFDTHPTTQKQNIKYSSTALQNVINIVNSPQPYIEFLDSLAGEYMDRRGDKRLAEDKKQSYRRFPVMIVIHENYYEMLMNKGYLDGTKEYEVYVKHGKVRGNMQRIAERTGENKELRNKLNNKVLYPVTRNGKYLLEREREKEINEEDVLKEFEEYGTLYKDEEKGFEVIKEEEENPFEK